MQISQLRILGREALKGVSEPEREVVESDILLSHATGMSRTDIIAYPDRSLESEQTKSFLELIERRKKYEPVAYILGRKEFFGYNFTLSPDVLIPRPETELLVELTLERVIPLAEDLLEFSVIDVGTGSGAIILSVARSLSERFGESVFSLAQFAAVDRSEEALLVAARNSEALDIGERILFGPSDLLTVFKGRMEKFRRPLFVVANLPYVPDAEVLPPDVENFEPTIALRGGPDGLALVRKLISQWNELAEVGEVLLLEVGQGQVAQLRTEFEDGFGFQSENDLSGIERIAILTKK
jgi:release factor glutamine methyltransferase